MPIVGLQPVGIELVGSKSGQVEQIVGGFQGRIANFLKTGKLFGRFDNQKLMSFKTVLRKSLEATQFEFVLVGVGIWLAGFLMGLLPVFGLALLAAVADGFASGAVFGCHLETDGAVGIVHNLFGLGPVAYFVVGWLVNVLFRINADVLTVWVRKRVKAGHVHLPVFRIKVSLPRNWLVGVMASLI